MDHLSPAHADALVEPAMLARVRARLRELEAADGIRVIYACESGSRAWGFPSANSDYDVRFIYARPRDWYVSIVRPRDVIELPPEDVLDINGWDIQKALFLLRKSNPVLLEWMRSPVVYITEPLLEAPLRAMLKPAFSPAAGWGHYWSMARQHLVKLRGAEDVRIKHYLYTMRPLLACRWIIDTLEPPPMLFEQLCARYLEGAVAEAIAALIERKRSGDEVDRIARMPVLDEYLLSEHERLTLLRPDAPQAPPVSDFDRALLETLSLAAEDPQIK